MNSDELLRLENVTLTYPDGENRLTALDDVELSVPAGTIAAVVGPSGSGKSSLLAVAATLIRPEQGRVVVDGVDTTKLRDGDTAALRREKIGIVFQQPNLLPALTSAQQLEVMAHISGKSPRAVREQARELLANVGLADKADRRPHQLSGGERQRVNIARALMNDPGVMLVDEPTSSLDHERGAEILDLLVSLTHGRGTSTVLVTHDRAQLAHVDRSVEIVDGRLRVEAAA